MYSLVRFGHHRTPSTHFFCLNFQKNLNLRNFPGCPIRIAESTNRFRCSWKWWRMWIYIRSFCSWKFLKRWLRWRLQWKSQPWGWQAGCCHKGQVEQFFFRITALLQAANHNKTWEIWNILKYAWCLWKYSLFPAMRSFLNLAMKCDVFFF